MSIVYMYMCCIVYTCTCVLGMSVVCTGVVVLSIVDTCKGVYTMLHTGTHDANTQHMYTCTWYSKVHVYMHTQRSYLIHTYSWCLYPLHTLIPKTPSSLPLPIQHSSSSVPPSLPRSLPLFWKAEKSVKANPKGIVDITVSLCLCSPAVFQTVCGSFFLIVLLPLCMCSSVDMTVHVHAHCVVQLDKNMHAVVHT